MKVGIMSMQRIENYGSFLQAYSLKQMLEELGHEVFFVDYMIEPCIVEEPKPVIVQHSIPYRIVRKGYYLLKQMIQTMNGQKSAAEALEAKRLRICYPDYIRELGVSEKRTENTPVDILIIGSDEVFNCLQTNPVVGYSKQLFGENVKADKVITYAASAGFTTVDGLKKAGIQDEVARMLKRNFSAFSVRDENTFELIQKLTGQTAETHLDPVLIADFTQQVIEYNDLENYVVVYSYEERMSNRTEEAEAIQNFAHSRGLKTVSIGNFQSWTDLKIEASPFELLGYIKNAAYVVTDTFHGTVFSIILEKKFGTIIRESNQQKLSSLLSRFGLSGRQIGSLDKLSEILDAEIDFAKAKIIRQFERKRALSYLASNLTK